MWIGICSPKRDIPESPSTFLFYQDFIAGDRKMNKQEFYELNKYCAYRRRVEKMLKQWKSDNHITERCVVHHRDDTEETRKYNEEHYERWGYNEDGSFEYGKYIVFMTLSEHSVYHSTGKKFSEEHRARISAACRGKKFSEEHRARISAAQKGKKLSDETRAKMSAAHKSVATRVVTLYTAYKNNGGTLNWNEFQKALSNGVITLADLNSDEY